MISGLEHVGEDHRCNVCSSDFTADEGGTTGYFGILPVAFCPTCLACMNDMIVQTLVQDEPGSINMAGLAPDSDSE